MDLIYPEGGIENSLNRILMDSMEESVESETDLLIVFRRKLTEAGYNLSILNGFLGTSLNQVTRSSLQNVYSRLTAIIKPWDNPTQFAYMLMEETQNAGVSRENLIYWLEEQAIDESNEHHFDFEIMLEYVLENRFSIV